MIDFLIFQSYMWGENALSNWASAVTILSLVSIPIAYSIKQDQKEKESEDKENKERQRASKNLHRELQDTLEGINRKLYPVNALSFIGKNGKEYFFMNRTLNHDFYDSLIFSGKINFLRPELQQHVQNIFHQIKTHNEYVDLVLKMKDETSTGEIPEKSYKYYEWLDENEVKLLKDIPIMLKNLEEDFDI